MSDSVRPHRQPPTRLLCPWDSPGKNTGVRCHFLLQFRKVKSASEVAQSCPTLSDLMDCSPAGSSIHGIFQARVLEWGCMAFSACGGKRGKRCILCCVVQMKQRNSRKLQLKFKNNIRLYMKQAWVTGYMKIHYIILPTFRCV